jgi:hypothetical protein
LVEVFKFKSGALDEGISNKPKQILKIQNEIKNFLEIKLLDFESFGSK